MSRIRRSLGPAAPDGRPVGPEGQPPSRLPLLLGIAVTAAVLYVSAVDTKVDLGRLWTGLPRALALFGKMWPPDWAYVQTVLPALADTIRMAVLGTLIGAVLALPFIILGARNLTRSAGLIWSIRVVLNLVRTVPDMLWAAIFVAALGIGPLPGVAALAAFSFGIIAKLTSESVEVIDSGPLEALHGVGANSLQVIGYAVVPQILPQFVAYCLYVFEINIRAAAVLGLVGAGGIGWLIKAAMSLFRYDQVAVTISITFLVVLLLDYTSGYLRERLI